MMAEMYETSILKPTSKGGIVDVFCDAQEELYEELDNKTVVLSNVKSIEDILTEFDTVVKFISSCHHDTVLFE
jgi:dephospho-CoA kinase